MSKATELPKGATFGPYTVIRPAEPDSYGRARYTVRATCCGRELVRAHHALISRARGQKHCIHCNSGKVGRRWAEKPPDLEARVAECLQDVALRPGIGPVDRFRDRLTSLVLGAINDREEIFGPARVLDVERGCRWHLIRHYPTCD